MAKLPVTVKAKEPDKKVAESTKTQAMVTPPVDIYETKTELVMIVDMPGLKKDAVAVKIDNGIIIISGKADGPIGEDLRYWEFTPHDYYRAFELGSEIDQEKIQADYKHGVLTVHLPKLEPAKPRQISVDVM